MQSTVQIKFQEEHLWRQLEQVMEMIANKEGTPISPGIAFWVSGLNADEKYEVRLAMNRVDGERYTYMDGVWQVSTKRRAAPMHLYKEVSHKDGVKTGREWMSEIIKFDEVRITNNKSNESKDNFIFTETMHLYRPVITFKNIDPTQSSILLSDPLFNFIPVTIYQHTSIGKWKAKNNKFATKRYGGSGSEKKEKKARTPTTVKSYVKTPVNIVSTTTNPVDDSVFAGCSSRPVYNYPNLKPDWNQDGMKNQRNALAPKENIQPVAVTVNPVVPALQPSDFAQMDPSFNPHYDYNQPTMLDYSVPQQYSNNGFYPPMYNNYWKYPQPPTAYYGGNENIQPQPQFPFYY